MYMDLLIKAHGLMFTRYQSTDHTQRLNDNYILITCHCDDTKDI